MCGYQGYEFGASYPDSVCIDGLLWDADSGDEEGLTNGGDLPCPCCSTEGYLSYALEQAKDGGCGLCGWTPHVAMATWEGMVAHARRQNAHEAERFLRGVKPFKTDDWPDRALVYANPHLWEQTVEREWRYVPA
jgi:hypothetical protein